MKTAREYGWQVGEALEAGRFTRAMSILETAVVNLGSLRTLRDYREPLSEIMTDVRTVNLIERCGAITVEQFYRTNPREFVTKAERENSSKQEIDRQSQIVYGKYSPRLHGLLHPDCINLLIDSDVLTVWDVCHTDPKKLYAAVLRKREFARPLSLMQREYA